MKYLSLAELFHKLESLSARLDKTYHISQLLRNAKSDEVDMLLLMIQGRVFAQWDKQHSGVAARLILKALSASTGVSIQKIETKWKKLGDLGEVAAEIISRNKQSTLFSQELSVKNVFNTIRKLATLEGQGTVTKKTQLISSLLTSAKPIEAKYITRTVLEDLRVGVGEGTLRDSIVWAYLPKVNFLFATCPDCGLDVPRGSVCVACGSKIDKSQQLETKNSLSIHAPQDIYQANLSAYKRIIAPDEKVARDVYNSFITAVQEAFDVKNDYGVVCSALMQEGLGALLNPQIEIGRPIKVMLAQKVRDMEEGFNAVGEPCEIEYKYDGFRMQIHKDGQTVKIYTRRLEDVTKQFPEVVKIVNENSTYNRMILDSEAIGFDAKTKEYTPFQNISQRIRRKHDIKNLEAKLPVEVNAFDILYCDGKNLIKEPFERRREYLEKAFKEKKWSLVVAKKIRTSSIKEAKDFYNEALKMGNEGVMLKSLDAPYKPGSRVGFMVKLKPVMDTLDLVITQAEWGEGKRSAWLSSFTVACIDDDGNIKEIGKVGTGFKEKEAGVTFEEMTLLLKPLIKSEEGKTVKVKPEIILEVSFEEIQKSPAYSSGYALRFPRLVRLRVDRAPEEATTLNMVEAQFNAQRRQ